MSDIRIRKPDSDLFSYLCYNDDIFTLDDIANIHTEVAGHNDENAWFWIIELNDGRFLLTEAWCDYSGWDCQSGGKSHVATSAWEAAMFAPELECDRTIRANLLAQLAGTLAFGLEVKNVMSNKKFLLDGEEINKKNIIAIGERYMDEALYVRLDSGVSVRIESSQEEYSFFAALKTERDTQQPAMSVTWLQLRLEEIERELKAITPILELECKQAKKDGLLAEPHLRNIEICQYALRDAFSSLQLIQKVTTETVVLPKPLNGEK